MKEAKVERPDTETLSVMMSHFIHLDEMMWHRVQWFIALQIASIGGAYALKADPVNSAFILGLCSFVTVILWLMMKRDEVIRDANKHFLELLHAGFTLSPKLKLPAPFKGRTLNNVLFLCFILFDLLIAVIFFMSPDWIK
ncbi:hypothetical protein [Alteromonas lipolytica]|uniref:Uncharacterized protein n=1 Tax=Alteromonas lipolytica TaxID=1856405 RepID=A0A1E8FA62_9ALTE|nr:hypothetical protein [Alteromonas lipolytica]OFI32801.1 hypothetical protein BFC17_06550 [Alteromonas lipolytica]GGF72870.1 hypothetical protein GCM10011338_26330 [Alteromonas lipolytica]